MVRTREIQVSEISSVLGLPYTGTDERINGLIKLVRSATQANSLITFCGNASVLPEILANRRIKALITSAAIHRANEAALKAMPVIISESPMVSFYLLHQYLCEKTPFYAEYDFPRQTGANCSIHPSCAIEDGVRIGNNVRIGPFTYIRKGTSIGDDCTIDANTVIGADGFEVKAINGIPRTVPHCGGVRLASNVEIGAGCVIDKAMFEGATTIGENTKVDNLVQIAHNCSIGRDVLICAQGQISGNVTIGDRCYLAPSASVRDQVSIVRDAFIGIGAVVTKHISEGGTYVGIPAKRIPARCPGGRL